MKGAANVICLIQNELIQSRLAANHVMNLEKCKSQPGEYILEGLENLNKKIDQCFIFCRLLQNMLCEEE